MVELPDPDVPGVVAPLLGVLGEVVELLPAPAAPVAPGVVPPVAPELAPDLLKWASHSDREIWPSLLVSTDEKVGSAMLEPAPLDDMPDEPAAPLLDVPLEPDADGVVLEPDADGVLLESDADGVLLEPDADGVLLESDADGVLLEPDADGVLLLPEDELCPMATPDRARRAAAVALVISFNIDHSSLRKG